MNQRKETVADKLARKAYNNTKPYLPRSKDQAMWDAHRAEENRLLVEFKDDVLRELKLKGQQPDGTGGVKHSTNWLHPKADMVFGMAWEDGHASGYAEVWYHAQRFAELVDV